MLKKFLADLFAAFVVIGTFVVSAVSIGFFGYIILAVIFL